MTATAEGAPNQVLSELRASIRDNEELTMRERGHLDAVVERLVHARAYGKESITATLEITNEVFSLTLT